MGTCRRNQVDSLLLAFYYYPVYTLGPGERIGVWFQGCTIRCKYCMSSYTWEFDASKSISIVELVEKLNLFPVRSVTISGGEPFDQPEALRNFLVLLKSYGFNDILVYSGYPFTFLQKNFKDILTLIDVIIDGSFIEGLDTDKIWKGSKNQQMYILTKQLKLKESYENYFHLTKNKNLQFIEYQDQLYMIGIPYQRDWRLIQYAIQNMPYL